MGTLLSRQSLEYIERLRKKKEKEAAPPKPKTTPKDKAKFAIDMKQGKLWMQKWIDWDDKSIAVGKRRVAYVRYLTMIHGYDLDVAKRLSVRNIK